MNRVMYREWFPQIVMNHHQTGPAGAVMFVPPCRDPFNYNLHPLVINGIERVSGAIVERCLAEDKPGVTIRTGARYSTWWNGGLSTTCQFHNMIGLFTETIGSPTPSRVPLLPNKLLPNSDYLAPMHAAGVALPAVGRVPRDDQSRRCSTTRRATARICCTTSG